MIETLIVSTIQQVDGLSERVFPVFAEEGTKLPFVVYVSNGTTEDDSLGGWIGSYTTKMEIHVVHESYKQLKLLAEAITKALQGIEEATVILSEDFPETYAAEVAAYDKIIHLTIFH